MKTYNDVLVYNGHITDSTATFNNPVPVLLNFNNDIKAGQATLKQVGKTVIADIELSETVQYPVIAWPACGGLLEAELNLFTIKSVAICSNPNVDPTIPPLFDNREAAK